MVGGSAGPAACEAGTDPPDREVQANVRPSSRASPSETGSSQGRRGDGFGVGAGGEAGGTGLRAFAKAGYTSGGKTGTAQVYGLKGEKYKESKVALQLRDHAWYIAYAPAEKPTIALAVLVENGGFGAARAAPIARTVIDYYLLGKTPDPKKIKVLADESKNTD